MNASAQKNKTVLSAVVYAKWLEAHLTECGGWTTIGELKRACRQRFERQWGKRDLEQMPKRNQQRWQNMLDWGKVLLRLPDGKKACFTRHSKRFDGGGVVILIGVKTDDKGKEIQDWVLKKTPRTPCFAKRCPECGRWYNLNRKQCECSHVFEVIPKRR
jgi:hypothetical protein